MTKFPWAKPLFGYGFSPDEAPDTLTNDPDSRLVPSIVEKVLIPWIER
jgi:hypothetical protein